MSYKTCPLDSTKQGFSCSFRILQKGQLPTPSHAERPQSSTPKPRKATPFSLRALRRCVAGVCPTQLPRIGRGLNPSLNRNRWISGRHDWNRDFRTEQTFKGSNDYPKFGCAPKKGSTAYGWSLQLFTLFCESFIFFFAWNLGTPHSRLECLTCLIILAAPGRQPARWRTDIPMQHTSLASSHAKEEKGNFARHCAALWSSLAALV